MMNMITKLSLQIRPCPTTITFFTDPHRSNRNTTTATTTTPLLIPACHLRFHAGKPSFMIKTNYMQTTGRLDRVIHHPIILCRASPADPPEINNGNYGKNSGEVVFKPAGKIMMIAVLASLCGVVGVMSSYRSTATARTMPRRGSTETTTTTTTTTSRSDQKATQIGSIKEDLDKLISRGKKDYLEKHPPSLKMIKDGDVRSLVEGPAEMYECGLLLIEILIEKGQYDEAEMICSYLEKMQPETQRMDDGMDDGTQRMDDEMDDETERMDERIVLRRFIIMLERAKKQWKECEAIIKSRGGQGGPEDSPGLK